MAMGTSTPGQITMFVSQDQLPKAPTAPFFDKLNELLDTMGFDREVEDAVPALLCRAARAPLARPRRVLPAAAARLPAWPRLRARHRPDGERLAEREPAGPLHDLAHAAAHQPGDPRAGVRRVLEQLREAGLANGSSVAVDATMLFANAALRTLRRKDTQQGYREFVAGQEAAGQEAHIPEPQRAERDFTGKPTVKRAVEGNRERVGSAEGKQLQKLRTEKVERSMAHMYETGAMRRLHLRGRENILKRLLVHASAYNLGVLMRSVTGIGTPRTLQGQGRPLSGGIAFAIYAPLEAALSGILGAISRILAPDGQNRRETGAELA